METRRSKWNESLRTEQRSGRNFFVIQTQLFYTWKRQSLVVCLPDCFPDPDRVNQYIHLILRQTDPFQIYIYIHFMMIQINAFCQLEQLNTPTARLQRSKTPTTQLPWVATRNTWRRQPHWSNDLQHSSLALTGLYERSYQALELTWLSSQYSLNCSYGKQVRKLADRSRVQPDGSLFNSYYYEVSGWALLLSLYCSTYPWSILYNTEC